MTIPDLPYSPWIMLILSIAGLIVAAASPKRQAPQNQLAQQQRHKTIRILRQPTTGWHGTTHDAAMDIFYNNRFLPGRKNKFWIADKTEDAIRFGKQKDGKKAKIVQLAISPDILLEKPNDFWAASIPDAQPGTYYTFPGIRPVAVYTQKGQRIL